MSPEEVHEQLSAGSELEAHLDRLLHAFENKIDAISQRAELLLSSRGRLTPEAVGERLGELRSMSEGAKTHIATLVAVRKAIDTRVRTEVSLLAVLKDLLGLDQVLLGQPVRLKMRPRDLHIGAKPIECKHDTLELSYYVPKDYACLASYDALYFSCQQVLHNALKHLPPESPRIHIQTCKRKKRAYLMIANNGSPILPEVRERLFRRFYRDDKVNEGTGIGLYSAKVALIGMNANMSVDDPPKEFSQGVSFVISLELAPKEREESDT